MKAWSGQEATAAAAVGERSAQEATGAKRGHVPLSSGGRKGGTLPQQPGRPSDRRATQERDGCAFLERRKETMSAIGSAARSRLARGAAGALLVTAMFGARSALADHDSNVIHACANAQGQVRIVGSASDCFRSETVLQWNERGPQGPPGLAGPLGPTGPAGPAGVSGLVRVTNSASFDAGEFGSVSVSCPSGAKVFGGGFNVGGVFGAFTVQASAPASLTAWTVSGRANSAATVIAYAMCASAT